MKELIHQSIAQLESNGFNAPARNLQLLEQQFDNQVYKVAFIGEFKTGKSTLINRIFIGEPLLFTDILEATAVPTELTYGPVAKMEIYNYRQRKLTLEIEEEAEISVADGLEEPLIIPSPTQELIKKYTAGDSDAAKDELARTTSHVRIELPKESLKGITLIDTPGVNSGTVSVLSTLFQVLPQVDLVVFVKKAIGFTQEELKFLTSRAFDQTGTRGMVLVNEDPRFSSLTDEERKKLRASMEAQLRQIGRIHLPIEWIQVPFDQKAARASSEAKRDPVRQDSASDKPATGGLLSRLRGESANPNAGGEQSVNELETIQNLDALSARLLQYMQMNAPQGHRARLRRLINRELVAGISLCKMELANLNRSVEDLQATQQEFAEQEPAMREKYMAVGSDFLDDLRRLQLSHTSLFDKGLAAIIDRYEEELSATEDLSDLLNKVKRFQDRSPGEIEEVIYRVSEQTKSDIEALQKKYEDTMRDRFGPLMNSHLESNRLYGGFLANIPAHVYYIIDLLLAIHMGPFGLIGDLILRALASKIPLLKRITPAQLAKGFIRRSILSNFRDTTNEMVKSMKQQLDVSMCQAAQDIERGWQEAWDDHVKSVNASLARAQDERTDAHRNRLQDCLKTLEACQEAI